MIYQLDVNVAFLGQTRPVDVRGEVTDTWISRLNERNYKQYGLTCQIVLDYYAKNCFYHVNLFVFTDDLTYQEGHTTNKRGGYI